MTHFRSKGHAPAFLRFSFEVIPAETTASRSCKCLLHAGFSAAAAWFGFSFQMPFHYRIPHTCFGHLSGKRERCAVVVDTCPTRVPSPPKKLWLVDSQPGCAGWGGQAGGGWWIASQAVMAGEASQMVARQAGAGGELARQVGAEKGAGRCWEVLGGAGRCWEVLGSAGERWGALGGAGRCWDALRPASPLLSDSPPPSTMLRSNEPYLPHAVIPPGRWVGGLVSSKL